MKKRSFSIKNKILIVLATLPIITVVAVVVMSTQSFTEDKLSYVYGTALSEARAKSSSTSSQIGSYLQIIKAITVNYDPQKKKLTNNGRTFFQGETSLKGFFSFRWDGSQFKSVFEQTKKTNLDEEERKPKETYRLGMNLEAMSVEALQEYLEVMEEEAVRVRSEMDARGEYRAAAEALFS